MGTLEGAVALVTGAGRGQGRTHAVTLAREGADIVAVDICEDIDGIPYPLSSPDELATTVSQVEATGRRAIAVQADTRSPADMAGAVSTALDQFGGLDIVIANAGVWTMTPISEITPALWEMMLGVNVTGTWNTVQACLEHFRERRAGSVVITGSCNSLEPAANSTHYAVAKHGLIGLMRSVAYEMAEYNVRCNAIIPGAIDTQMNNWQGALDTFAGHAGGTQDHRLQAGENFALLPGAGMLPTQVMADAAAFLVSPAARWITGVVLPVDAGHLIKPAYS